MDITYILYFLTLSISFVVSWLLTDILRNILSKNAVLDIPNERSSHQKPVPRGGGLALLLILIPSLIISACYFDHDARHFGLILGVILLAFISWYDDRKHASTMMRLSFHILAACLGALSFSPEEHIIGASLPFWLDRAIMIISWAWFINLYNFMDGIDGITGTETISIALGLGIIFILAPLHDPFMGMMVLVLGGVSAGFLIHNWHPAKIFLGDVGSVPLGYLIGFGLISLATKGHLIAALILPLYYLADSGLTLSKRALDGKKIWQAHREHFYQKATLGAMQHDKVVLMIISANACLILIAALSLILPWFSLILSILIIAVLLGKMHKLASKNIQDL